MPRQPAPTNALAIQPDLSLCTVIRQDGTSLRRMLTAVFQAANPVALELIVVDMSEGLAASVLRDFPQAVIYEESGRENPVTAGNRAMQLAAGRYVALMDHDVIPDPDCFTNLLLFLDDNPDIGIAAPRIINPYGGTEPSCRTFPSPLAILACYTGFGESRWGRSILREYLHLQKKPYTREVDWLCSGMHVIRREALEEIGFFDNRIDPHFIELDYYARARKTGWHNFYCAEATARHARPEKYHPELNRPVNFSKILTGSCRYFYKKWLAAAWLQTPK